MAVMRMSGAEEETPRQVGSRREKESAAAEVQEVTAEPWWTS